MIKRLMSIVVMGNGFINVLLKTWNIMANKIPFPTDDGILGALIRLPNCPTIKGNNTVVPNLVTNPPALTSDSTPVTTTKSSGVKTTPADDPNVLATMDNAALPPATVVMITADEMGGGSTPSKQKPVARPGDSTLKVPKSLEAMVKRNGQHTK